MKPISVLVVDDDPLVRRGLALLTKKKHGGFEVLGEAGDGPTAVDLIHRLRPELIFLDVNIPGIDGFDVLGRLSASERPAVIFVTGFADYAVRAFDVHAVDFLTKPFNEERYLEALHRAYEVIVQRRENRIHGDIERLLEKLDDGEGALRMAADHRSDRVLLKTGGEIIFLKLDEIDWIEAEGDYMKFHAGGKSYLLRETMAQLESKLDPEHFLRVHRSTIVNVDRIQKLTPVFNGEYVILLRDGTKLKMSRGYQDRIQGLLRNLI